MLEACKRNDVRLAIGHEWRWMDLHVKARSLIAEAAIGEPFFAYIGVDPGGLMNRDTHQINYTLFVLGDPKAKWVLANVQRETDRYERGTICEDLCMGIASVGDGTRIAIDCDIRHVGPLQDRSFMIAGENGMISIEPRPAQGVAAHSLTVVSSTGKSFEVGPRRSARRLTPTSSRWTRMAA